MKQLLKVIKRMTIIIIFIGIAVLINDKSQAAGINGTTIVLNPRSW